jgi:hypothetical protein
MTFSGEITPRRADAHRKALIKLSATLVGAGLRCLLVERVHLVVTRSHGPREHLPPYLEVRNGARLVVTVWVSDRLGRRPCFMITLPGGLDVRMSDTSDAESTAGYVRRVPELQEDGRGGR